MLRVENRIGIIESKTSGSDSPEECLSKDHFLNYTKDISYNYNSRGFRDNEWPDEKVVNAHGIQRENRTFNIWFLPLQF